MINQYFILKGANRLLEKNSNVSPQFLNDILKTLSEKVGGDLKSHLVINISVANLEQVFTTIPLEYVDSDDAGVFEIFKKLIENGKLLFVEKYVISEKESANNELSKLKKINKETDQLAFTVCVNNVIKISERLLKVYKIFNRYKHDEIVTKSSSEVTVANILKISYTGATEPFSYIVDEESKKIEETPNTSSGEEKLIQQEELLNMLGLLNPELVASIRRKRKLLPHDGESLSIKNKKRIIGRLINTISMSQLPVMSNKKIETSGDYFKLFKALEDKNKSWMDLSLMKYVFKSSQTRFDEFSRSARNVESSEEEYQLIYLDASRSWILSYIKSTTAGILDVRAETNYINSLENTFNAKSKEIKNYYLSRDFNLGNFGGIKIHPEVNLPLYKKVKLMVSEKDRLAESPLKEMLKGVGKLIGGFLSAYSDKGDEVFAQASRQRNIAVASGISSILKGAATLVGGKQAGRNYQEQADKVIPVTTEKGKLKEDMLSASDSPNFVPMNLNTPGQTLQTPGSVVGDMDVMALSGYNKRTKPRKKAKSKNRVKTFSDFLKFRSK